MDSPERGSSQVVHLVAESGFWSIQMPHCHLSLLAVGGFRPAAAKSKPFVGAEAVVETKATFVERGAEDDVVEVKSNLGKALTGSPSTAR